MGRVSWILVTVVVLVVVVTLAIGVIHSNDALFVSNATFLGGGIPGCF